MRLEYLDMIDRSRIPARYFRDARPLCRLLDTLGKLDDMSSDVVAGNMPALDAETMSGLMIESGQLKEIEPVLKEFYEQRMKFHNGSEA